MLANSVSPPVSATAWALSIVAMIGMSSVQPSMCQSKVPRRYCAAGFFAGSSVTRKISGNSPSPKVSTSPSFRLKATWVASSRWRSRKTSTPLASRASRQAAGRSSSCSMRSASTSVTSAPTVAPSFSVVMTAMRSSVLTGRTPPAQSGTLVM